MIEPTDPLTEACVLVRDSLREAFAALRSEAARWEPRPCPSQD